MTAVALIVAAGRGERLGSSAPKALVALAGRPMLEWSVAALRAADGDRRDRRGAARRGARRAPAGLHRACAGGAERSHSVRAALAAAPADADVVLVHDAARPLLTPELVDALPRGARRRRRLGRRDRRGAGDRHDQAARPTACA